MPTHTNGVGAVMFGGVLVEWIDVCAAVGGDAPLPRPFPLLPTLRAQRGKLGP